MSVKNIGDKNIGLLGLPYIIKQALGNTLGNIFLIASAIAITVCCLAVLVRHASGCCSAWPATAGCRSARRWHGCPGAPRVPIVPALFVGVCSLILLGGAQPRQPVGVPHAHLGGDHHVLPRRI